MPHMQNTVHRASTSCCPAPDRVRARAAAVGAFPARTRRRSASRSAGRTSSRAVGDQLRDRAGGDSAARRCACRLRGARRRRSPSKAKRARNVLYRVEESRGYECARRLWSPGYFRVRPRRRDASARWSRRPRLGDDRRAARRDAGARGRARAAPPAARAGRPAARGRHRRRAGARGRSVHHHAGRPHARTRRAPAPPATRCARSSPATTGSPTGAATR